MAEIFLTVRVKKQRNKKNLEAANTLKIERHPLLDNGMFDT